MRKNLNFDSTLVVLAIFLLLMPFVSGAVDSVSMFQNQKNSSTNWGEIDLDAFFSFKKWKNQSDERELVPEWESIINERRHREIIGRFFQCVGNCRIYRGQSLFGPSYRSAIYEGDELQTIGDSYAWIFLLDGTMVRLSPESSINLNELNIGVKENFLNARVNYGNIVWLSRNEAPFIEENVRETDVLFFPLSMYEARAVTDKKPYVEDNLIEMVEEKNTVLNQFKHLNTLIEKNNKVTRGKMTYAFIVMPNVTIMGYNPSVEIVSLLGGKTYLKKRSATVLGLQKDSGGDEIVIQVRGFKNNTLSPIENDKWIVVDETGRDSAVTEEHMYWFAMGEFITKHIPSLMVARELLLQKYSEFAFREKYDAKKLALEDGYRLWGLLQSSKKEDLEKRLDFLKEYFRRVETTNLVTSMKFSERLKSRGESSKIMEYEKYFFIKALNKYYSHQEYSDETESGVVLNSTTKAIWKRMHDVK